MSQPAIIDKLSEFLTSHLPFSEECHVVYFLVEVRKLIDLNDPKKYPLIKFYCDWCVHTQKNKITPEIKSIMKQVYADIVQEVARKHFGKKSKVISFIYLEDVLIEMQSFFTEWNLDSNLFLVEDNWIAFISLLVNVLTDQPIVSPTDDIQEFRFTPANVRCVRGVVLFKKNLGNQDRYIFGNTY